MMKIVNFFILLGVSKYVVSQKTLETTVMNQQHNLTDDIVGDTIPASTNFSCNLNFFQTSNDTKSEILSPPITIDSKIVEENYGHLHSNFLRQQSFLYALASSVSESNEREIKISDSCSRQLDEIRRGIDEKRIWAMKVMDASASPQSGFTFGQNFWLGSSKLCDSVTNQIKITISNRYFRAMKSNLITETSPFDVEYRVIHGKHQSPWQFEMKFLGEGMLHMGICVPKTCTNDEIKMMSQSLFDKRTLNFLQMFDFNPQIVRVKDLTLRDNFFDKITVRILMLLIGVTCVLTLIGLNRSTENPNNCGQMNMHQQVVEVNLNAKKLSTFDRIIKCFSVRDNFKWLMKTETSPASIPVINGLRSIACIWICAFHVFWFKHYTVDNSATLFAYAEKFYFQCLANAAILVDLFFAISGFLTAYNFLKNKKQMEEIRTNGFSGNLKIFGKILLQRYVRLTTLYLVVILTTEIASAYLNDVSKFHLHEDNEMLFEKNWWRNLIYIQNLTHDVENICANWTWSLACEMQYFVIFMAILFVYAKNAEMGKKLFTYFAVGIFLISFGITIYVDFNAAFDVLYETGIVLYVGPWARIHPYYAGIFIGYLLMKHEGKMFVNKTWVRNFWAISTAVIFISFNATIKRDLHRVLASLALSLQRLCFGLSTTWIIIASMTGNGNWFTRFLEAKPFVHINKVSYGIYLINPVVMTLAFGLSEKSSHTDVVTSTIMSFALTMSVYLLSIVYTLFFEIPYNKLSDEFLKSNQQKTKHLQQTEKVTEKIS